MPSIGKPRELYLAKSLSELTKMANISPSNLVNNSLNSLSMSALRLYNEAVKCSMDEEKAYVLLFRCVELAQMLLKKNGGKPELAFEKKPFDKIKYQDAMNKFTKLSNSLQERYKSTNPELSLNLKNHVTNGQAKTPPTESNINGKLNGPSSSLESPTQNGTHSTGDHPAITGNVINCIKLYELMHDKSTSLIIFDCRPQEEFETSHISHSSCVNIPAEILQPGITAAAVGLNVPSEAKALWNKRSLVDFVVLMDKDSNSSLLVPHGPLNSLNLAMSKWETNNFLKSDPLILENGFDDWIFHYPTTVTSVTPVNHASLNNPDFRNSLPFIDVEYPDLDDGLTEKEIMNTAFDESFPTEASERSLSEISDNASSGRAAFFVEKNVENPFSEKARLTQTTQVPTFDRTNKPKPFPEPKEAWPEPSTKNRKELDEVLRKQQKLADKRIDNTRERLEQERKYEEWQIRKENAANVEMLELIKQQEEQLLIKIRDLEEHNRQLQEKAKHSEAEKDALRKQVQTSQTDEHHRVILAQKQDQKRQLDAEVEKLRQERKKREKEEKLKELKLAEEQREDKRRAEEKRIADLAAQMSTIKVIPPKPNKQVPDRPATASSVMRVSNNSTQQQDESGDYSVRLKDEPEGPTLTRGLTRSHSSPNINQLGQDDKDSSRLQPIVNHSKLDKCCPSVNRALKPMDNNVTRLRNFSPVFSSQPNTQTGLKNLGNTCFMNSVLQCLCHTRPLAAYLVTGAFQSDVKRSCEGGSRGEVIQELASVFLNLFQTYRSISPYEFKNTVSRYMSVCEGYDQQDAHEFLVVLMEKLHTETNQGASSKGASPPNLDNVSSAEAALNQFWIWHLKIHNSPIVQMFEGVLQSRLTCSVCNHRACTYEVFSCLSLPIPAHNKCSLQDCIQSLLKAETMKGEAAWKCPNCKQKQQAEKKMALCRLPSILIIHLKRFSYEGLWRRKLATYVDFPLMDLNMDPYLIVPTKRSKYNLYGVVNHYGTLEGGHYKAFCKSEKWFCFDDHDVQQMNIGNVKTSAAYILFYASVDLKTNF